MKIVSQMKDFDRGEKWQDLDVTTWPIVENFHEQVQSDGYVESESQPDFKKLIYLCVYKE